MPYYVAFSLFRLFRLPCLPLPVSCLFPPSNNPPSGLASLCPLFPRQSLPIVLTVSPCRSLPFPREKIPPSGLKNPPKIPRMGTKIAVFAGYRSENGSKNLVNTQIHKDFHKLFCDCCTMILQSVEIVFSIDREKMQFRRRQKCNSGEKCRAYTGCADRAGRQRQPLTAGTQHTATRKGGDKGSSGHG